MNIRKNPSIIITTIVLLLFGIFSLLNLTADYDPFKNIEVTNHLKYDIELSIQRTELENPIYLATIKAASQTDIIINNTLLSQSDNQNEIYID
ncbi:MAG: hypothetical protein C5B43_02525 [Verrucomicrobia bacterium]|nr:MAG: hypothetical protein C5B43_02525 [Verrucomicrobiota bacterium]